VSVSIACPAGTKLVGGGASTTNSDTAHPARVQLVVSRSNGNSWEATAAIDVGLGQNNHATVNAYAICAS